jgi:hypothetical protein
MFLGYSIAAILWLQYMAHVMLLACSMSYMKFFQHRERECVHVRARNAQYGCFLYLLDVMLSKNVAHVFSK